MKHKLLGIFILTGLLGGCMATITPSGEVYTDAVFTSTIVESYPQPIYVRHSHHPRPVGPLVSGHRPSHHPGTRNTPPSGNRPHRPR